MMDTDPRPTSSVDPTDLLWNRQLKRENAHLLIRIQALEATNAQHAERLKQVEDCTTAISSHEIEELSKKVDALSGADFAERITKMERNLNHKIDSVQIETQATSRKVSSLEKSDLLVDEEKRKAVAKEKAFLKRLAEIEDTLKEYRESLAAVGTGIDEHAVGEIREQLKELGERVQMNAQDVERVEDGLLLLETALAEVRRANERLLEEVKGLAEMEDRAVAASVQSGHTNGTAERHAAKRPAPGVHSEDEEEELPSPSKKAKKAHKWAGGGADKGIIAQALQTRSQERKPMDRNANDTHKSHKWAGGGADKDIIAQGLVLETSRRQTKAAPTTQQIKKVLTPPKRSAKPAPTKTATKKEQPKDKQKATLTKTTAPKTLGTKGPFKAPNKTATKKPTAPTAKTAPPSKSTQAQINNKPIIRSGKGWVEYEDSSTASEDEEINAPGGADANNNGASIITRALRTSLPSRQKRDLEPQSPRLSARGGGVRTLRTYGKQEGSARSAAAAPPATKGKAARQSRSSGPVNDDEVGMELHSQMGIFDSPLSSTEGEVD